MVMGASRGIGRGIAAALAREGARVAVASRSEERIHEAAAGIGEAAAPFVADASDLERLAALHRNGQLTDDEYARAKDARLSEERT